MQAAQRPVADESRAACCARATSARWWRRSAPGEAFLVEFVKNGKAAKGECDWMGVLYPTEIELGSGPENS